MKKDLFTPTATSKATFQDHYTLGNKLDTVSDTESIYSCIHKASKEERSVQMIAKSSASRYAKHYFQRQVAILKTCTQHPNLLDWKDSYEDDTFYYIVTDSLDHPNVLECLSKMSGSESQLYRRVAEIIRMVIKCVTFLHSHGICHGNLQPQYLLVRDFDLLAHFPFANLTISHFDQATIAMKELDKDETEVTEATTEEEDDLGNNLRRSTRSLPPETETLEAPSMPGDVWAIGILTFFLLTGEHPFGSPDDRNQPIQNWYSISNNKSCREFIQGLLAANPNDRPTLSQIQIDQVPWIDEATGSRMALDDAEYSKVHDRFRRVQKMNALEAAVHSYTATNLLLKADREELDHIFLFCDRDNDGVLSREEFAEYMLDAGCHDRNEINEIFECIDIDKTNKISYKEFITFAEERDKKMELSKLQAAFNAFDVSQTGHITTQDLVDFFQHTDGGKALTEREARQLIHQADRDGDGQLSFDDFSSMLLTRREQKRMRDKKYKVPYDQVGNDRERIIENRIKMKKKPIFFSLW